MNDDVQEILNAHYLGRKPRVKGIDNEVRIKVLRLKAASAYAYCRLLSIIDLITNTDFFMTGLLECEDGNPGLAHDAIQYSQEQHLIHLQSLVVSINMFCFFKNVLPHAFMALTPGFLDRLVEACLPLVELIPDRDIVLREEKALEREYQAFNLFPAG